MIEQSPPEYGPFANALQFHEAGWRAAAQVPHENDPNQFTFPVVAVVACYAFAAELYIKSLAMLEGRNPKEGGHRLNELFKKLTHDNAELIASAYREKTGRNREQLEADLAEFGNAFHEWRYVYEMTPAGIDITLLNAFARAAYVTVRMRAPEWPSNPTIHAHIMG